MSEACLSNVHRNEIKSSSPIFPGKTIMTSCILQKNHLALPWSPQALFLLWWYSPCPSLSNEARGRAGGWSSVCIGFFLRLCHPSCCISSIAPLFFVFLPWLRSLAVSQGVSTLACHLQGFISEQAVPPAASLPRPCQVCLITSVKSNFQESLNDKYLQSAVPQPFPSWISTDHHKKSLHITADKK